MIRVVQMGLGPIGRSIAKSVGGRPGLKLVGAVDPDPALAGADLGTVIGGETLGLEVRPAFDAIDVPVDLVLHATGSSLREVASQLQPLLGRGLHVLSTCEELAYPYYRYPELSKELDSAARENGAALGLMDNSTFIDADYDIHYLERLLKAESTGEPVKS